MISDTALIALQAVNFRDEHLRITTRKDVDELTASIKHLGMINLPVLRSTDSGYCIVCGFRRIQACRLMQMKEIPVRLVNAEASVLDCVELAISDNAMQRDLNELEMSRCLSLLSPFYQEIEMLTEAARRLGLKVGSAYVRKLLCVASLSEEVQKAVGDGHLSISMAESMAKSDSRDTAALTALLVLLRTSLNKQREIIQLCREIAKRDGIAISTLLENPDIRAITDDRELDGNRKTALLRDLLKKRRMPVLSEALKAFDQQRSRLNLGQGVRMVPPPGFEGRNYRLTFDFSTRSDLEGHLSTMKQLLRNPAMEQILSRKNVTES